MVSAVEAVFELGEVARDVVAADCTVSAGDWVKADVFKRMFDAASDEPDMEYAMIDATTVWVHRQGEGAKATVLPVKRFAMGFWSGGLH